MKRPGWMKIHRTDVMFVFGGGLVLGEVVSEHVPNRSVLITGLILMGVPVLNRIRNGKNGDA